MNNIIELLKSELIRCKSVKSEPLSNQDLIRFKIQRGNLRYYYKGKYLNQKNKNIRTLVENRYFFEMAQKAKCEENALKCCISKIERNGKPLIDSVLDFWPQKAKELIESDSLSDDYFVKQWRKQTWIRKKVPDRYTFFTLNGEHVRSKSEVIIADRLREAKVPYIYEKELFLSDGTIIYPDFTILNRKLKKEFLWEHFGMMDDSEYLNTFFVKMDGYFENGYYQGKNLIVTFESGNHPINSQQVDKLIMEFLV